MPSRLQSSAMLYSPFKPSSTILIFSSAEYCFRVARLMSFTTGSDDVTGGTDFCLISVLQVMHSVQLGLTSDMWVFGEFSFELVSGFPSKSLKSLAHPTGSHSDHQIQRVRLSNLIGEPIISDHVKILDRVCQSWFFVSWINYSNWSSCEGWERQPREINSLEGVICATCAVGECLPQKSREES